MALRRPASRTGCCWTPSPTASSTTASTPWPTAINARLQLLHTVRAATALAHLNVGDLVRINHKIKPRYLHGALGKIIDLDERHATICLQRPIGRFTSGHIRCPPLALERIPSKA